MSLVSGAFFVFAVCAVASALVMVTRKSPVASAVGLITHFFCLSGLYLTLQAQLLAALQILVYAGAIMVLVTFVIMLLNLGEEEKLAQKLNVRNIVGIVMAGLLGVQIIAFLIMQRGELTQLSPNAEVIGSVNELGRVLFTDYLFPFEAVSLLLLAAVVGSVVLAKRNLES
ncbi:MAG: NADH-quinone oxidoreductase subunit J [Candidatus Kapaibacterium sp.]|nr:MAG: NADH-quinone oxidoreductase subunit J [Candidatus Kapabacteria bacterium]